MFEQKFENVIIKTVTEPKRGACLEATNAAGVRILMDYCGMNPTLVPDGTNAYLFGNSVIFVTRWSDMSDSEKKMVEDGTLCLAIHPCQFVQFSLRVNDTWSDVFTNLHHCYDGLNDETQPVTEAIFIFSDTHDSDYVTIRSVKLPLYVQKFLQKCNASDHKAFPLDLLTDNLHAQAQENSIKDYWDMLYDLDWANTQEISRRAREYNPDDIPNGVYIEITKDNRVTDIRRNEGKVAEEAMSGEVKLCLELAEQGIPEGQYNLGVCYETGDGVRQNYEKALFWYKKAVEQGYDKAQYNMGVMLYNGYGVEADHEEAARLFLLAAQQGNMYAQYNIGVAYYTGDGVEKDIFQAVDWFKKAAEQGHPDAKKIFK